MTKIKIGVEIEEAMEDFIKGKAKTFADVAFTANGAELTDTQRDVFAKDHSDAVHRIIVEGASKGSEFIKQEIENYCQERGDCELASFAIVKELKETYASS